MSTTDRRSGAWRPGAPLPSDLALLLGLVLPVLLATWSTWRVRSYTVDDAYISYRYARNFAHGLGLVYNEGERVEGYTNFLWTVLLAGGIKLGFNPDAIAKLLGAASTTGGLALTYAISGRALPYASAPCIATWLLASSAVFTGWSVFGLETGFFVCLVLAGIHLFFLETDRPSSGRFPWSGAVFALAGLTRPEAPMFVGILMLTLGTGIVGRQNLVRGVLFAAPIAVHVAFRRAYYGAWLPNTFAAKTGDLSTQLGAGAVYVQSYAAHAGIILYVAVLGAAVGVFARRRDLLSITALALAVVGYVVLVGGDWMKFSRFMAPFEPLCFILVDVGLRRAIERRDAPTNLTIAVLLASVAFHRVDVLREARAELVERDGPFWERSAGATADWLSRHEPGTVAIGDIGYVGWRTSYPVLDLLGLVDPVIGKLPGAYTQKLGPGLLARFFDVAPRYTLIISSSQECNRPSVSGSKLLWSDPRFLERYELGGTIPLDGGFAWCIYQRR